MLRNIVLFGSRAKGNNTERSDIDMAVYGGDFDGFYWENIRNIVRIEEGTCSVPSSLIPILFNFIQFILQSFFQ